MLGIIAAVLIVLWLLGFFAFHVTSGLIHIVLVVGNQNPAHQLSHEPRFARAVNQPATRRRNLMLEILISRSTSKTGPISRYGFFYTQSVRSKVRY